MPTFSFPLLPPCSEHFVTNFPSSWYLNKTNFATFQFSVSHLKSCSLTVLHLNFIIILLSVYFPVHMNHIVLIHLSISPLFLAAMSDARMDMHASALYFCLQWSGLHVQQDPWIMSVLEVFPHPHEPQQQFYHFTPYPHANTPILISKTWIG